jgi:hypothetical protein
MIMVNGVKNRDFVSTEVVDAAFEAGGCANAFREGGNLMAADKSIDVPTSEDQAVALAESVDWNLMEAQGDEAKLAAFDWQTVVSQLVAYIMSRWFNK